MAIIYTYPRLLNPDGTELIVVSETKNQNATRLLTVGAIVDLWDCTQAEECGFCSNTFRDIEPEFGLSFVASGCDSQVAFRSSDASVIITGVILPGVGSTVDLTCDTCPDAIMSIVPPLGDEVKADGCDQVNFTSSDASVTITGTNATKTVDFKAVGGGGGGCPPTYLIRPIECDDETYECIISEEMEYWVWTCDPTLGALAPGYLDTLQINGIDYPHPTSSEDACWYIELATLTANTTDCDTCCPELELVYKLTPCPDGEYTTIYYTNDANSSGPGGTSISDYDGQVILATTPEGEVCYTVSQENGPVIPVTIVQGNYDDCLCCVSLRLVQQYKQCENPGNLFMVELTQLQLDDLIANGVASAYYYLRVDLSPFGLPGYACVEWDGPACTDANTDLWDTNPADCDDQTWCPAETILLTPCDGNEQPYTTDIVTNEGESPTLIGVNTDDIVSLDASALACYIVTRPVYLPLSGGPVTVVETFTTNNECNCCLSTIRRYEECNNPGSYVYFDLDNAPAWYWDKNSPPPCLKAEFPTQEYTCYEFVDCEQSHDVFTPDSLVECDPDCDDDPACAPDTIRYEQCVEAGDPPGSMAPFLYFEDNGSMPTYIVVTHLVPLGSSWCYVENDDSANLPEDPNYAWVTKDPQNCETCEVYEYFDCADPSTPLYTNNSAITNAGFQSPITWSHDGDPGGCYETVGPVSLPIVDLMLNEIVNLIASYPDCPCCTDHGGYAGGMGFKHRYNVCSYEYGPPAGAPATVVVDLTAWLGTHPNVITVTINGIDICYEWDQQVCEAATHNFVDSYDECWICWEAEGEPYVVEVEECISGNKWYVPSSCFDPSLYDSGIVNGDVIEVTSGQLVNQNPSGCFEIIDMNSASTTTLACPPDNIWNGPIGDNPGEELDNCDCCELKLYTYAKCGTGCDASVAVDVTVDLGWGPGGASLWPVVPPVIRATDLASGFDCCFDSPEPAECQPPTGTYVATVDDCASGPCYP